MAFLMLHRLILKATKFQLPTPKCLSTVVKNILGGHHGSPCQIGLGTHWLILRGGSGAGYGIYMELEYFSKIPQ